jgi:cytidine deaminase
MEFAKLIKNPEELLNSELVKKAFEVREKAYAIYSNFKVGAGLLLKDGTILTGCNVENASYGLSNCAERSVLFESVGKGVKPDDIVALIITSDSVVPASPCGACRQVINELMPQDAYVISINIQKTIVIHTVSELLPFGFGRKDLNV